MKSISTKKEWIPTNAWRGRYQPIHAVAGANNTGSWSDSPCPSHICEAEIKGYRTILRKNKIRSKIVACPTSNVFCMGVYVCVHPDDRDKALDIAREYEPGTELFYTC